MPAEKGGEVQRPAMLKRLYELGSRIAGRAADMAGHPAAIVLVAVLCGVGFWVLGAAGENTLTLILSVASITLTQMVLNGQRRSERAMHLKMDELVYAIEGARNEVAGIEAKSLDVLDGLRRPCDDPQECADGKPSTNPTAPAADW